MYYNFNQLKQRHLLLGHSYYLHVASLGILVLLGMFYFTLHCFICTPRKSLNQVNHSLLKEALKCVFTFIFHTRGCYEPLRLDYLDHHGYPPSSTLCQSPDSGLCPEHTLLELQSRDIKCLDKEPSSY